MTKDNDLFYLVTALVTKVFEKTKTKGEKKQTWWKRRLESQVKELHKDLGRLNASLQGNKMKKKHQDNLQKRYKLKENGKPKVKEEILQKIKAKTAKMNRYQQKMSDFQQNGFFRNNVGRFYKQIDGSEEGEEIVIPDIQEAKTFWADIWGKEVEHNTDTTWLREIRFQIGRSLDQMEPNLHKNFVWHLDVCLERETPRWMTKVMTVLIQKDKSKGNKASNYHPITCLHLTWKLLTGIIAGEIYGFLENEAI